MVEIKASSVARWRHVPNDPRKYANDLIAEETAPALVAVTLPRLLAGAVETSGVADALIAQFALPS